MGGAGVCPLAFLPGPSAGAGALAPWESSGFGLYPQAQGSHGELYCAWVVFLGALPCVLADYQAVTFCPCSGAPTGGGAVREESLPAAPAAVGGAGTLGDVLGKYAFQSIYSLRVIGKVKRNRNWHSANTTALAAQATSWWQRAAVPSAQKRLPQSEQVVSW